MKPQTTKRILKRVLSRDGAPVIIHDARTKTVAQFYGATREADSALFLAADDLLSALCTILPAYGLAMNMHGRLPQDFEGSSEVIAARAAIARAKGGAS